MKIKIFVDHESDDAEKKFNVEHLNLEDTWKDRLKRKWSLKLFKFKRNVINFLPLQ